MEVVEFKYPLGTRAKDKVSGLVGMIISRCENLNGCLRYTIQPPIDKDGKIVESYWFDEDQIEIINEKPVEVKKNFTGGPPTLARQEVNKWRT